MVDLTRLASLAFDTLRYSSILFDRKTEGHKPKTTKHWTPRNGSGGAAIRAAPRNARSPSTTLAFSFSFVISVVPVWFTGWVRPRPR